MDSIDIIAYISFVGVGSYIFWQTKRSADHCLNDDLNFAKEDFLKAEEYESRGLLDLAKLYYGWVLNREDTHQVGSWISRQKYFDTWRRIAQLKWHVRGKMRKLENISTIGNESDFDDAS